MQIKKFTIDMYPDVFALWKAVDLTLGSSDTEEETKRMLERNPDLFLVGEEDGKIVGVVIGGFDGRRGYVHHLAVDPAYQKRGYGKLLMEELTRKFAEMNVHKVHLFIEKRNIGVVDFYEKLGWHVRDDLIMMSLVPDKEKYFIEEKE
ncbi:MAG: GNAT family N-acetyltransferase [Candidatus Heimdallarchaeaceae archaeon]